MSTLVGIIDLPASSRFATVDVKRSVAFAEADLEAPGESHVVVGIRHTGVCAADTHGWASGGLIPAAVFGHEWTGTVVAVVAGSRPSPWGTASTPAAAHLAAPAPCTARDTPTTATPP
jgi:NADPH:quinone reductase-like Zn-dependent oxidoreductase